MKGTEKQIKYANDIIAKCELSMKEYEGKTSSENYEWMQSIVNRIKSIDDAALIITGGQGNTDRGMIPQEPIEWRSVFVAKKQGEDIIIK